MTAFRGRADLDRGTTPKLGEATTERARPDDAVAADEQAQIDAEVAASVVLDDRTAAADRRDSQAGHRQISLDAQQLLNEKRARLLDQRELQLDARERLADQRDIDRELATWNEFDGSWADTAANGQP